MHQKIEISMLGDPHSLPPYYDRTPSYNDMIQDRDVMVPICDGVRLCVDIYRPGA